MIACDSQVHSYLVTQKKFVRLLDLDMVTHASHTQVVLHNSVETRLSFFSELQPTRFLDEMREVLA
jgi:hypothetical protein